MIKAALNVRPFHYWPIVWPATPSPSLPTARGSSQKKLLTDGTAGCRWSGVRAGAAAAKIRVQVLVLGVNRVNRFFHRSKLVRQFGLFAGDLLVEIVYAGGKGGDLFCHARFIVCQHAGGTVDPLQISVKRRRNPSRRI